MTLEEAIALVLREGFAGEDTPDDAALILLHSGDEVNPERMSDLLRALRLLCGGLQGQSGFDRSLAAALWTLGNSANECLAAHEQYKRPWRDGEQDDVLELILTIEGVFYGIQFEGLREQQRDN